MPAPRLSDLEAHAPFADRHIGPSASQRQHMLAAVGYRDLDELTDAVLPAAIRDSRPLELPTAASEPEMLAELAQIAAANRPFVSMIGAGYSDTITPAVIRRNVLENPAWYTAYTPYQPEISQGRLEALLTFQTMVGDLTALPVANASLLDEPTAAAEAMALCRRVSTAAGAFVVDRGCHPQTLAVLATRAAPLDIELVVADLADGLPDEQIFGVLVQYPATDGSVRPLAPLVEAAHARGALVVAAADLLALTLLRAPGEDGVDVAVGSTQRFGVPMGYGGPHAGYLAVRTGLERALPGRLVGVTVDAAGALGYRLTLQAREQHIRRERATSNICTAQVLLAVVAAMYAVYHGPDGLRAIAQRVHRYAAVLAAGLRGGGVQLRTAAFFDTVAAVLPGRADEVVEAARRRGVNLRRLDADTVGIACDEVTRREHLQAVWAACGVGEPDVDALDESTPDGLPPQLLRVSEYLTHPSFHHYRSETAMMRYLRRLAGRDIALDRSMIPLGSCTMKLNAAAEMEPISWAGFARMHPFAPAEQAAGYRRLIRQLEGWLAEITGYAAVSVQPNAGSQGELAGLLAIRGFLRAKGEEHRRVCLIPASAHGTNAASAVMAGLRVVVVATDQAGNVDLEDLQRRIDEHQEALAAIMLTYPSTHGVFEPAIRTICDRVHAAGGQVYVDGANLNAMVGLSRPGEWGADVSHLNLHKTFCIPHGGGGPGVGPVAVAAHLVPYLPSTADVEPADGDNGGGRVSGAPWGSAGILPISWAYIRMMGPVGLRRASQVAILSANYLAARLGEHYPILYTGQHGLVAHECIVDLRPLTKHSGITVEDVAKRLMDYGFHAPTISFPVAGTMMVEPTESEDLGELDRFVAAMSAIRAEIERVATGEWDREDNPLRNAPHTAAMLAGEWTHPYSREEAAFPGYPPATRGEKFWPPVRRLDQAYGDRNLMCACPPLADYTA